MRMPWTICSLLILTLFVRSAGSQARYRLSVSVDEVSVTFHAADVHGLPINDLKLEELRILDNGKPPDKVLVLQFLQDFPIRAGILLDTSESMEQYLPRNRAIAIEYANRLLRQQTDQAFVMDFNFLSQIAQPWTNNSVALTTGIHKFTTYGQGRIAGTAIISAIYQACLNQFDKIDHAASGNFILLFSDGEDNASHAFLHQAVAMCQGSNTAIYAFHPEPKYSSSSGPRTLAELTSETGGRLFYNDDSETEIYKNLQTIQSDLRNQYRLVYKPAELKRDGSFHHIEVRGPARANNIVIRSGYYAPSQ